MTERKIFNSIHLDIKNVQDMPFITGELSDFNIVNHPVYVYSKLKKKDKDGVYYIIGIETLSKSKAECLIAKIGNRWALYNTLTDLPEFFEE